MKDLLYLAARYLSRNRVKAVILVLALTITLYLPVAVNLVVELSERYLVSRSGETPLVLGSKGSSLDLVMDALYFQGYPVDPITPGDLRTAVEEENATYLPIHSVFTARDVPVVGTSLGYFRFRGLAIERGAMMTYVGETVAGAEAARSLGLVPGDTVATDPENLFDLAGSYPLKLRVTGILESTGGWDDKALFVDVKTAWVIAGYGHGHQNLTETTDRSVVLRREKGNVVANAALTIAQEITEENREDFHFHGSTDDFPLTAGILIPGDDKSHTILLGRYRESGSRLQLVEPADVISRLLDTLFRIRELLNLVLVITLTVTTATIVFILALTVRMRRREGETLYMIGGARSVVFRLMGAEVMLLLATSFVLAGALVGATLFFRDSFLRYLLQG